jgi:glycosyltransferase involved in cell wall biosynthesis
LNYFFSDYPYIVSLHGNSFLSWDKNSLKSKIFHFILNNSDIVTILGSRQKDYLISQGVPQQKIILLNNTCQISPLSQEETHNKHCYQGKSKEIQILFLSNLLLEKGFVNYVKAIDLLSHSNMFSEYRNIKIKAILCGRHFNRQDEISDAEGSRNWINKLKNKINTSPFPSRISFEWIESAYGTEKEKLFHKSHIFVFPSFYKVESQPIVLIEAIASGLAVITSDIGEISSSFQTESMVFLPDLNPITIQNFILNLIVDDKRRSSLAKELNILYQDKFSSSAYSKSFSALIKSVR